ncbi:cation:proton antiporter [Anaerocolumna xylanovorans]|uniref:Sodium/proton-potassium antiporter GerN, CPA2 family (TC 2.A.37.2.2) n=1 Tax=Anaerocolumna xylanovorans DSM 12503 TaxID=1121345 RepID=A0A1M7XVZ5_9FIRM|nr:cation:proton antiporter [Anaerocolumna xylanovorans]SHO42889.1 sodium/proton-potassium antiporter GerN, CPA2 family (TC 2.A.37.2.2) [Anaerocolumna xylanovorans DSM 12503]
MENALLSIALVLIATKLGGMIIEKFKMPEVLGALLAGVILGPMVFNAVPYDDNIKLLANIGVILLMFHAGLETDFDQFRKSGKTSAVIAVLGVFVPLILGSLCAFLFYSNILENIFIGIVFTATSVSITVETLNELGKLHSRVGINILGAAVIDDILGLMLISVLLSVDKGSGRSVIFTIAGIMVFFLCFTLAAIYLPKHINTLASKISSGKSQLAFSIASALLIAFTAEHLGIAAITGAYLFGLLLSRTERRNYLERGIKTISSGFLSPIFFASVGLSVTLDGITAKVLLIAIVMFLVAVTGKVIGCGCAARFFKMKHSESLQIGIGMISRGEVAIITANIGVQNGIITQEVFIPTILVVLLTTVITPLLLKLAFSHKAEKWIDK